MTGRRHGRTEDCCRLSSRDIVAGTTDVIRGDRRRIQFLLLARRRRLYSPAADAAMPGSPYLPAILSVDSSMVILSWVVSRW